MKSIILKGAALTAFGTSALYSNIALAKTGTELFGNPTETSKISGATEGVDKAAQTIVSNVTGFLVILAVLYGIWGGIKIMTAAGNDEQVGEGKKIIIQSLIGMVVIYLAGSVVQWLVGAILK